MIAYNILGSGKEHVIVMHDWFCDSTSYDPVLPYLNTSKYQYNFVDLRGYGKSRAISGDFTVDEVASDVLAVASSLGIERFHLVGHSMSGMIAQYIAMKHPARVRSGVAITPVPACGSPAPADAMAFMTDAAQSNLVSAKIAANMMSGQRLCEKFVETKAIGWHACSTPEARVAYLNMFANTDFSNEINGIATPFLVIAGEHDIEGHSFAKMHATFGKWFKKVEIVENKNSAHYPMQETPVWLATLIEKHFAKYP